MASPPGLLRVHSYNAQDTSRHIFIRVFEERSRKAAVSYFNLSRVHELAGNYDSALGTVTKSLSYWEQKKDTSRIVTSLNQRLAIEIKTAQYSKAKSTQEFIGKLIENAGIHWRQKIDFYILSATLYEKLYTNNVASQYKLKAEKLQDEIEIPTAISSSPY